MHRFFISCSETDDKGVIRFYDSHCSNEREINTAVSCFLRMDTLERETVSIIIWKEEE